MGLSSLTVEITVMSGENVRVKEEACVVVRAETIKSCTTKMAKNNNATTNELCDKGNEKGSSDYLCWNEKMLVEVPLHARSITFEVRSKSDHKGVRPAGVARMAVSDVLGGVDGKSSKVLSYRLRDWEGRRNGIIHFSVRMAPSLAAAEPVEGVPVVDEKNKSSDVVLGVPFWWNYPNII